MYINTVNTTEKATQLTKLVKDLQEKLTSLDKDWSKRNEELCDDLIRRIEGITSLIEWTKFFSQ